MLCFITTDAAIAPKTLKSALAEAVAHSFNRVTVDGDMSTNDTVLVWPTSGGNAAIKAPGRDLNIFQAALNHVTLQLAKMIVRDGEGGDPFRHRPRERAKSFADADAAARAVANSALVKTSWHGGDPNWGGFWARSAIRLPRSWRKKLTWLQRARRQKVLFALKKGQPAKTSFTRCAKSSRKENLICISI